MSIEAKGNAMASFKESLQKAQEHGHIYNVDRAYVKIRRWSLRAYFDDVSNWRIKLISNRISKRMNRKRERVAAERIRRTRRDNKRAEVLSIATAALQIDLCTESLNAK